MTWEKKIPSRANKSSNLKATFVGRNGCNKKRRSKGDVTARQWTPGTARTEVEYTGRGLKRGGRSELGYKTRSG